MGWRIRHGIDVSTTGLLVIGGLAGAVVHVVGAFAWDHFAHHHRGTLR